ncbi:protein of unknown function (DUF305) [Humitalea rosea]|uniref:DUF305 domain-containing protein n=1 Tax=Humitalea rosea TaxID=990373 RepID=A0A2W7J0H4_9PROT|nr:DUF305 domain-containing protein [Humitalea rosea]PZW45111.1 protein of unknown function (DUF305) [Humitalea rosea]
MTKPWRPKTHLIGPGLLLLVAAVASGPAPAHEGHHHAAAKAAASVAESGFLAENEAAMTKMMDAMSVPPSGDLDRDFVAMMAPHHGGAIDMAVIYLHHGHNEQLKRLAQEIIVTQQQEIAAMQLALGEPPPPSSAAPTQPSPAAR